MSAHRSTPKCRFWICSFKKVFIFLVVLVCVVFYTIDENGGTLYTSSTSSMSSPNHHQRKSSKRHVVHDRTTLYANSTPISNSTPGTAKPRIRDGGKSNYRIENNSKLKKILYWTQKYNSKWDLKGFDPFEKCEFRDCQYITDKSKLEQSKMVLFFNYDEPNFPRARNPDQLYLHILRDPPRDPNNTFLDQFDDKINITTNHRTDADIPAPNVILRTKPDDTGRDYVPRIPLANKTRSVAWIVSHCRTSSRREDYVQELKKHIDVDIYGKCGDLNCPRADGLKCFEIFEKKYKFFLSFENRVCEEYVSEKLYKPLTVELVPVVLGMYRYTDLAPPHSVIDVRDFKSPKDLATFLWRLSSDEREYYEYFAWKTRYELISRKHIDCDICASMHSREYERGEVIRPAYARLNVTYKAWFQQVCDNDLVPRMRSAGGW